jgi:type VI secretion system protein ImpC
MSRSPISFGKIDVGLSTTLSETPAKPASETPFRILVLGDFSGRTSRGVSAPAEIGRRKPILIDRDNFDEVLARMGVEVRLSLAPDAPPLTLRFRELDDFHPDRLVRQVALFDNLRGTRERLKNPSTFKQAAAEVRGWANLKPPPAPSTPPPDAAPASGEDLLNELIGEAPAEASGVASAYGAADWSAYLARIVQPHLAPKSDPQQADLVAAVDEASGVQMRAILHHPAFQAIESAWRGLYFLVRRLDTDANLRLHLLDVAKSELAADLGGNDDLTASGMYKLLVEQTVGTPGASPWAVVAGNYMFDQHPSDVELLGRMAKIAAQAGAPFLAGAGPRLLACRSLAATPEPDQWQEPAGLEAWEALRRLPEAAYLGLALPRILQRLPYGKETSPIEQFEFEEMGKKPDHEAFLWGNPAFACVYLLAEAFSRAGWDMRPGMVQEINGLPLYVNREDEEVLPCAETVLVDRAAAAILNKGIMPIRSVRNQESVILPQFQSIADPAKPLAGRWL